MGDGTVEYLVPKTSLKISRDIPRLEPGLLPGERWSNEPIADPMVGDRNIEKSDRHSRGGRLSFSLTVLVNDRERERSLFPEDGLESPENVL